MSLRAHDLGSGRLGTMLGPDHHETTEPGRMAGTWTSWIEDFAPWYEAQVQAGRTVDELEAMLTAHDVWDRGAE